MKQFRLAVAVFLAVSAFAQSPFTGSVTVEKVATNFLFTEGPCWRSDGGLLFSDVSGDAVYEWTAKAGAQPYHKPSGNSNGLALDSQGRLLLAQHGKRRVARREVDGSETALATHYGGKRLNSPNDLAVKSDGSIWFTDPNYGVNASQEELGFYGVYRVTTDPLSPELLSRDLRLPNGIAFSPDESRLYVADTDDARVVVFDVSAGKLVNQRVLVQKTGDLSPDGIKVDTALTVAGTTANKVTVRFR
jgi:sugar lactone lactonase YvrE